MIYAINAIAFAWIASFWSKSGGFNLVIALGWVVLAILNGALAAPFIYHLVGQP